MKLDQLLREWPPGFGGVERVAHEIASALGGSVYSLDVQNKSRLLQDPLSVDYPRIRLPRFNIFGRLHLPLPSLALFDLLLSNRPLHGHLPSPSVLLVLILAKVIRPHRFVSAHWHCFLEPVHGISGRLYGLYQWFALLLLPFFSTVVTTSPQLYQELKRCGCRSDRLFILPCSLSPQVEKMCLSLSLPDPSKGQPLKVLFIGRLDTYKRVDWLLESLAQLTIPFHLTVVGDGPLRQSFEQLTASFIHSDSVRFLGCISESEKLEQLSESDVLVLPSDRCNEAFGIVQLEAMASGRISLAFDQPRSGMGWVGQLTDLPWSQSREALADVLLRIACKPALRHQLCLQSRERYQSLFARNIWLKQLDRLVQSVETGNV